VFLYLELFCVSVLVLFSSVVLVLLLMDAGVCFIGILVFRFCFCFVQVIKVVLVGNRFSVFVFVV